MLSVQTPAKINLFLNIRPRRADGFHEIASVMQAVQLWDQLDVQPRADEVKNIRFTCNHPQLEKNPETNLIVKAYRLFWQETGLPPLGLKVHLHKEIPMQAGLGGGSSDAAAMLLILNHLSHANLSDERLREIGAKLGSDVPFFISGGIALASGRGELIQPLPASMMEEMSLVIIKPRNLSIDTSLAYHRYATGTRYENKSPDHILMALHSMQQKRRLRDEIGLDPYLLNDFEKVLFPEYPMLAQMARLLKEAGIQRPVLSGSGSAMWGFCKVTSALRKAINEHFPESQFEIFWTQTHAQGVRQVNPDPLREAAKALSK